MKGHTMEYMNRFKPYVLIIAIVACAHKAPPLTKDRLAPRLQAVSTLNSRQVQLVFNEGVDTLQLNPEHMSIMSAGDSLGILVLYPSLSDAEIIAVTEPQLETTYEIQGYVFDTAGNKGIFQRKFRGMTRPDTIAPWLVSYSQGKDNNDFLLTFSEAMDTTFLSYYIIPQKDLQPVWSNYRTCRFVAKTPADSLHYDTTYYLYISRGARDMSSNVIDHFITSITPDTIYDPLILRGTIMLDDTLVKTGVAVLRKEYPIGIAIIEAGEFAFEVRDSSTYIVEAVYTHFYGRGEASVARDNVITARKQECDIDTIIH
jgi:hypothetical protein